MKLLLTTICFTFFATSVIAQEDTDQATIRCYYFYSQKKNKSDKDIFFRDTLTLDIGPQMSRYYSERKIQKDSVFMSVLSNFDPNRIQSISVLKDIESNVLNSYVGDTYKNNTYDGISEQIYKNRNNGNIIMLDSPGNFSSAERYKGTDPVGTLNWTILPDSAVFLDYSCQKASLSFRGRNYEAWFAPQIPVGEGPWKFFGLPGLILKVIDTDGQFDFECIGLEYLKEPYLIKIPEHKYFECNRKDYNKVMDKKSSGQAININGGNILIAQFKADPSIQPMELE